MKTIILSLLLSFIVNAQTIYYTSNSDLGNGSGSSSANAKHFAKFIENDLGSVNAGDIIYIDGGSSSMVYNNATALYPQGGASAAGGFFIEGLDGTSSNRITFTRNTESGHNGTPIFRYTDPAHTTYQTMLIENCSYLTFSYLQFDSTAESGRAGVYIWENSSNIDIVYNNFYHLVGRGVMTQSPNTRILHNRFWTDTNNTETNDPIYQGIGSNHADLEIGWNECYLRNLSITTDAHQDGFQLNNIKGTTLIHDNFVVRYAGRDNYDNGHDGYGSQCLYVDNGAEGNLYIWNNIFVDIGGASMGAPLSLKNEDASTALNVFCYNNTFYGGFTDLAANNNLGSITYKNNLYHHVIGWNGNTFEIGTYPSGSTEFGYYNFDYNVYYMADASPFGLTSGQYTYTNWKTHIDAGFEAHSSTQTASFTVVDNTGDTPEDWKLASGSNGIDEGVDLSGVYPFTVYGTQDYFGTERAGTWDVDASEYQAAVPTPTNISIRRTIIIK